MPEESSGTPKFLKRPFLLQLCPSTNGLGVFTADVISAGSFIMDYRGALVCSASLPCPYNTTTDHYVQVGSATYLGPSGDLDDYVNHSCDPNCWLRIAKGGVSLVALRDIAAGEELTFDYSTTMWRDDWTMKCDCGVTSCRGTVGEFSTLSADIQDRYRRLRIIPPYIQP